MSDGVLIAVIAALVVCLVGVVVFGPFRPPGEPDHPNLLRRPRPSEPPVDPPPSGVRPCPPPGGGAGSQGSGERRPRWRHADLTYLERTLGIAEGAQVIRTPGLPEGYTPPSASLTPPTPPSTEETPMTAPARYRKKPVVIEAMRCAEPSTPENVAQWCGGTVVADGITGNPYGVAIETMEGTMRADWGDWVIKGVQGEFYPRKPDIFEATYERVDAP